MALSLPSSIVTPIVTQVEFHPTLRFWCHKQIIGEACGKKQQGRKLGSSRILGHELLDGGGGLRLAPPFRNTT
jgi:hypothetical protein